MATDLTRRNAHGDGESNLVGNPSPETGGDGFRRYVGPDTVSYIEKGLVERKRLDEEGNVSEYLHDLARYLVIAIESR